MLAGFQITKQNGSGTGKVQITHLPNADKRNLLQTAAKIAKHSAFHRMMLVSILYSFTCNLSIITFSMFFKSFSKAF